MTSTTGGAGQARLVLPNQLFEQHLRATAGTRFVLVEHDLLVRQLPFHAHKLVLHRASELAFADRLRDNGFEVDLVESRADRTTADQLGRLLGRLRPGHLAVYEPVDDWIEQDLRRVAGRAGLELEELPTPAFCTSTADVRAQLGGRRPRMQHFYEWQRRRLDLLVDGDRPVGGRWSFDADNRKRLPKGVELPEVPLPEPDRHVATAVAWVREEFPDAPGDPATFAWPTTRRQALVWLRRFVRDRLASFGPYEDAITDPRPAVLVHSVAHPGPQPRPARPARGGARDASAPTRWRAPTPRCRLSSLRGVRPAGGRAGASTRGWRHRAARAAAAARGTCSASTARPRCRRRSTPAPPASTRSTCVVARRARRRRRPPHRAG